MNPQRKNLLLVFGLSLILPACAPTLPMLAIGAATYVAQTQLSKPQETPAEPPAPAKTKTAVEQKKLASPPVAKKGSRRLSEQCRRVSGGTECTL
jgi:hypothetical protein